MLPASQRGLQSKNLCIRGAVCARRPCSPSHACRRDSRTGGKTIFISGRTPATTDRLLANGPKQNGCRVQFVRIPPAASDSE